MSFFILKCCFYTGSFNYRFNEERNAFSLSYLGVALNFCSMWNIVITAVALGVSDDQIAYLIYVKFALVFLISASRFVKSHPRRRQTFYDAADYATYFRRMGGGGGEFRLIQITCGLLFVGLTMERFFFPFSWFTTTAHWRSAIYPFLIQLTILLLRTVYLAVTCQICIICFTIEMELKSLLQELEGILNACVINNNDIFLVSHTLAGLSNNYNRNIRVRKACVKSLITKYLKLMTFIKGFNQEYRHELFLLYMFYLNSAEDFLSSVFRYPWSSPNAARVILFLSFKLFNVLAQFVYLSFRCYRVKKQYFEFEHLLINYDNLCEQGMFNLINVLLHKLNINRVKFSALDFVHIDMELFSRTVIGLVFLTVTLITETDRTGVNDEGRGGFRVN